MIFTTEQIAALAREYYGLDVSVKPLPGEIDLNFCITDSSGRLYTLKIANPAQERENLEFQHAMIRHLGGAGLGLQLPRLVPSVVGDEINTITAPDGLVRFLRVLTWIEGRCLAHVNPHTANLLENLGEMCGKITLAMKGFDHPNAHRFIKWDVSQAAWTAEYLHQVAGEEERELARYFLQLFENQALPYAAELGKSVIYNDANDYNILVSHDLENPLVPGVIDFGDAVYTHTINELAIAAAYAAMDKPDPLAAICSVAKGFHRIFPLTERESEVLLALIGARLLISVTCSAMNMTNNPGNVYLQISDRSAWDLMKKLRKLPPVLFHSAIRHACGWEPCLKRAAFNQWIETNHSLLQPVVPADLSKAVWLDLGVGSADLGNYADIEDAEKLHRNILEAMNGRVGIGRYNETRPFYTSDAYEVRGNNGPEWRTVHIGLDIFMPPGTAVFAPLDGIIHSFQDNANDRDYGPAIILEHRVSESLTFYTLYGHLTRRSLRGLQKGQAIRAGEVFCEIGPMPENGNWSPHLHFQVMLDTLGNEGDFPGVTFHEQRDIWTSLCPDPWLLLTGNISPQNTISAGKDILDQRNHYLGKNLSLSYRQPLTMLRGWRQYLFDETGRRYLDTVNNVAHVGHEHPRVVRAGQRQMAVLNTNTRYLHDQIVRFSEEILQTFPKPLEVVFMVNSGSEANELAMRLAKTASGQRDMIVMESGYHGNTQACIEVSSYKFDGPGGKGAAENIHVLPLPDTFRGIYRGNTAETAQKYAAHISEMIARIQREGRVPAAFICESVISCGGQITLPPGYLQAAVKEIRSAGGFYIADEVQTGCGRHGRHFWAFEEHDVVPDIVTIGKPIGNGHPLGVVVTTKAIADAFANGMEYFNTFGGNAVSCAIGREVLQVIRDENLQQNAQETGEYLIAELRALSTRFPIIGDVRGSGLFLGVELVKDRETLEPATLQTDYLLNRMRELGILMSSDGPFHNVLKIKPPMVFGKKEATFLLETLERVLREDVMR